MSSGNASTRYTGGSSNKKNFFSLTTKELTQQPQHRKTQAKTSGNYGRMLVLGKGRGNTAGSNARSKVAAPKPVNLPSLKAETGVMTPIAPSSSSHGSLSSWSSGKEESEPVASESVGRSAWGDTPAPGGPDNILGPNEFPALGQDEEEYLASKKQKAPHRQDWDFRNRKPEGERDEPRSWGNRSTGMSPPQVEPGAIMIKKRTDVTPPSNTALSRPEGNVKHNEKVAVDDEYFGPDQTKTNWSLEGEEMDFSKPLRFGDEDEEEEGRVDKTKNGKKEHEEDDDDETYLPTQDFLDEDDEEETPQPKQEPLQKQEPVVVEDGQDDEPTEAEQAALEERRKQIMERREQELREMRALEEEREIQRRELDRLRREEDMRRQMEEEEERRNVASAEGESGRRWVADGKEYGRGPPPARGEVRTLFNPKDPGRPIVVKPGELKQQKDKDRRYNKKDRDQDRTRRRGVDGEGSERKGRTNNNSNSTSNNNKKKNQNQNRNRQEESARDREEETTKPNKPPPTDATPVWEKPLAPRVVKTLAEIQKEEQQREKNRPAKQSPSKNNNEGNKKKGRNNNNEGSKGKAQKGSKRQERGSNDSKDKQDKRKNERKGAPQSRDNVLDVQDTSSVNSKVVVDEPELDLLTKSEPELTPASATLLPSLRLFERSPEDDDSAIDTFHLERSIDAVTEDGTPQDVSSSNTGPMLSTPSSSVTQSRFTQSSLSASAFTPKFGGLPSTDPSFQSTWAPQTSQLDSDSLYTPSASNYAGLFGVSSTPSASATSATTVSPFAAPFAYGVQQSQPGSEWSSQQTSSRFFPSVTNSATEPETDSAWPATTSVFSLPSHIVSQHSEPSRTRQPLLSPSTDPEEFGKFLERATFTPSSQVPTQTSTAPSIGGKPLSTLGAPSSFAVSPPESAPLDNNRGHQKNSPNSRGRKDGSKPANSSKKRSNYSGNRKQNPSPNKPK